MEFISKNEAQTRKIAWQFALKLKGAEIIALRGDLGSGKTFFVREILRKFGIKERIQSPTFVLRRSYSKSKLVFEHFDLYRLDFQGIETTGLFEVLGQKNTLVFIEWPEKVENKFPQGTIFIEFTHLGENRRKIRITKE